MSKNEILSAFGFLATILVVMCHVDNFMAPEQRTVWVRYLGGWITAANTANFFLLSGYFLARKFDERGWYVESIKKRVRTLLVPYMLWGLVYLGINIMISGVKHNCWVIPTLKQPFFGLASVWGLGWNEFPFDLPLWYIKSLFYFILISAPFYCLIKKSVFWLSPIAVVLVLIYVLNPQLEKTLHFSFPPVQFLAFLIGSSLALHKWEWVIPKSKVLGILALLLWGGVAGLAMHFNGSTIGRCMDVINILGSILALYVFVSTFNITLPDWIVQSSFFIYAAHWMLLIFVVRIPVFRASGVFAFILYTGITVGLLVLVANGMGRFFPRLSLLLSGGRGVSKRGEESGR